MKGKTVTIADIKFSFLFDEDGVESNSLNETDTGRETEIINFRMHPGSLPVIKPEEIIFDSGQTWALFRGEGKYVLQDDTLKDDSSPDICVVLESDFRSGDIFTRHTLFHVKGHFDPLGYPLNQVLMILLMSLNRGILFHACGIHHRGRGYLFLGNSGHGKTTMARLWSEEQGLVLNDDRIVVREKEDRFWMYGTPWHGDLAEWSTTGVPIHKIFILNAGVENSANLTRRADAVSMLLTRCFPPIWNQRAMGFAMKLCDRLVGKIPCHELRFEPDKKIVDFIRGMPDRPEG